MDKSRLLELDAIRGIAAISVVIFHYFYRYDAIYGHDELPVAWSYIGNFGVQLFFMVSGFVIYWTLNRVEKPVDFIVSRFSRLYPVYWFSGLLTFSIVFFIGLPGREVSIYQAFLNILMFHEYMGVRHIDGVYWTLTVELTFYFWVFIFFITGLLKYTEYIFTPIIIISILQSLNVIYLPNFLNSIFITQHLAYFLAGICFYKIANRIDGISTYVILALCLTSTLFLFSVKVLFLSAMFYLLFYLATTDRLKILSFKPFVFLGGISYSLYLLHQNIGYVIINALYSIHVNPLLAILIAIFASLILAYLATKYIERPSLLAIRNIYHKNYNIPRKA